jgi:hypothetical protein
VSGDENTAVGASALPFNTSGSYNVAYGAEALYSNTTGNNNTALGWGALNSNKTGFLNTALGYGANVSLDGFSNSTAIGHDAIISASNQVRIGNSSVTSIGGYANWSNVSDGRVKKNVKQNVPGLAFINKLNPITYNLDLNAADKIIQNKETRDRNGKVLNTLSNNDIATRKLKEKVIYSGFIAQEVEKVAKELNYEFSGVDAAKNENDLYSLRYADFVVPLVKAIQELSQQNQELINEIKSLQNRLEKLEASMHMHTDSIFRNSNIVSDDNLNSSNLSCMIYPNPAKNIANLQIKGGTLKNRKVLLTDLNGKILWDKQNISTNQITIPVHQLAAGTCLVKMLNGKETKIAKLVKE